MKRQAVFQEEKEMNRLAVQNRLLLNYEAPIFTQLFAKRSGLSVLDIGCNDGTKTIECFSNDAVSQVIGLEYNHKLAKQAQARYGGEKFSFYSCDVESVDFSEQMKNIMREKGIKGFDIIYLSFLLMHLKQPAQLLAGLQEFLLPDGQLIVIEANDSASVLEPDYNNLLQDFLEILKKDKYSGNRELGAVLPDMLRDCGYTDVKHWYNEIAAGEEDVEKKMKIFTMFFSYLPEDVEILQALYPEDAEYKNWAEWIQCNFGKLKKAILQENSSISMGMRILSCK